MITVASLRKGGTPPPVNALIIPIHRPHTLGNPFKVETYGREQAIELYRLWLWRKIKIQDKRVMKALNELIKLERQGETVVLMCWCAPLACHGDVIVRAVEWLKRE